MQALSIKQPWAWLICAGYKDVENRNWKAGRDSLNRLYMTRRLADHSASYPFRIYVHTGKGRDINAINIILNCEIDLHHDAFHTVYMMESDDLWALGAIIGEVDITDCVTESSSPWFIGKYGFVLANPVLYEKPIPYKGQLGFFEVDLKEIK